MQKRAELTKAEALGLAHSSLVRARRASTRPSLATGACRCSSTTGEASTPSGCSESVRRAR
eukprot:2267981-Pleurochrysis_carterae.AAC.5